ncbi:hypothetical protein B5G50_21450 [Brevibacillus brevis]|uniref:hypothetical protein n=1 Tax=Brevibacillus brevis TaxID=1393 RepID=UPI000B36A3B8|nr:hypothetical protein [Brevibacillus brevis]OUQ86501.1 hypothetical protein B5G50_21450 [Brevibacillus brevis]
MIEKIESPKWAGHLKRILSNVESGIFNEIDAEENEDMGEDWWYIKDPEGNICGLLWISSYTDDLFYRDRGEIAEISFCIQEESRGKGILSSIIGNIEDLVKSTYKNATLILAVSRKTSAYCELVSKTFQKKGYHFSENESSVLLQKEI